MLRIMLNELCVFCVLYTVCFIQTNFTRLFRNVLYNYILFKEIREKQFFIWQNYVNVGIFWR